MWSHVLPREVEDVGLEDTSQYKPYETETQNKQSFPQLTEELEPMPEVRDHYIRAKILLPRGDKMAKCHFVARSQDANGNVMGRSHTNSILDMRMFQVEFARGEVTALTANIIAESMYVQCNSEGNEYLLLDVLVDYQKDNEAIFLSDQQIMVWGRPVTCKTTADWQICCQWKDGSTSWEKLCELKKSHQHKQLSLLLHRGLIMSQLLTGR